MKHEHIRDVKLNLSNRNIEGVLRLALKLGYDTVSQSRSGLIH